MLSTGTRHLQSDDGRLAHVPGPSRLIDPLIDSSIERSVVSESGTCDVGTLLFTAMKYSPLIDRLSGFSILSTNCSCTDRYMCS